MRFWQHYARELDDDSYGIYNYNWGYYLESLRLLCETRAGKPFEPPDQPEEPQTKHPPCPPKRPRRSRPKPSATTWR